MYYLQNAVEELASGNTDVLNNPPVPVVIEELNDIRKYFLSCYY